MNNQVKKIIGAVSHSVALVSLAAGLAMFSPDRIDFSDAGLGYDDAIAKNNGNGRGNGADKSDRGDRGNKGGNGDKGDRGNKGGNGNKGDRGGKSGNSGAGNSSGASAGASGVDSDDGSPGKARGRDKPKKNSKFALSSESEDGQDELEDGLGNNGKAIKTKLGALNAAHASSQAFANASSNSRVGLIKSYYEAYLGASVVRDEAGQLDEDLEELAGLLEGFEGLQEILEAEPNGKTAEKLNDEFNEALDALVEQFGSETVSDLLENLEDDVDLENLTEEQREALKGLLETDLAGVVTQIEEDIEETTTARDELAPELESLEETEFEALVEAASPSLTEEEVAENQDEIADALNGLLDGKGIEAPEPEEAPLSEESASSEDPVEEGDEAPVVPAAS
jgi:hypothetical protein